MLALPALAAPPLAPFDALDGARPARALANADLARLDVRGHQDERLGVPSFLWVGAASPARALAGRGLDPEQAAREQFKALAPLYRLSPTDVDALQVFDRQTLPGGAQLLRLRQTADGIEVFRETLTLLTDADGGLSAVAGHVQRTGRAAQARGPIDPAASGFRRDERSAMEIVLQEHGLPGAELAAPMQLQRAEGAYRYFSPALPARVGDALALTAPLRVKPVWFRLPTGLVPAWYVESQVDADGQSRYFAHVVSAKDDRVLFRRDLTADAEFSYRVWADTSGDFRPALGPQAPYSPHPTGIPDGSQPAFVAPSLVTLQNAPFSRNDPWLADGATQSLGNNVDAYADVSGGNGFDASDIRASVTAPGVFDRSYDPLLAPNANAEQRQAAITQLFFTNNWLHDAFYDAGFDEIAGNAQADNFARGGVAGDRLLAEAQDSSGTNNANMSTPADGAPPRMQMYVFTGISQPTLTIQPGNLPLLAQKAAFGPQSYDITAAVVAAEDGSTAGPGTVRDGCQAITTNVAGQIALLDRGACEFQVKVQNAQNAGAVGVLIAYNVPTGLPAMGGTNPAVTIPSLGIGQADGAALRTTIGNGATTATMQLAGAVNRDGTIDNGIVAHEWGHYISNRLVGNAAGLTSQQGGGMGEGWGDFHALMMIARPGMDFDGAFSAAGYAMGGAEPNDSYYFGIRRFPYSTDLTRNGLSFRHIQDGVALPTGMPISPTGNPNSAVHGTGEVWASMLWECYTGLLKDSGRLSFDEAEARMKRYLVGGYKLTPNAPTFIEARDALLAVIAAESTEDHAICAAGFAKRGAGVGAVAPPRESPSNTGVVESFDSTGGLFELVEATLDDQPGYCDLDGVLDGGETGTLRVRLRNTGFSAVGDGVLTVSSADAGVSFPQGASVAITTATVGGEGEAEIRIALAPSANRSAVTLTLDWDGAGLAQPGDAQQSLTLNFDELLASSASDDAEAATAAWTPQLQGDPDTARAWSRREVGPLQHVYAGPDLGGIAVTSLVSPPLQVSTTQPLVVAFSHRFQFESSGGVDWDGGVIEVSTNDGSTWTDVAALSVTPGYNGTITDQASNPFETRAAYVATSTGYPALQPVTLDFGSQFAGQTLRLRFAIGSDEAEGAAGWEIDDIAITGITNTPFNAAVAHRALCAAGDILGGDLQATRVDSAFEQPLSLRVTDPQGAALGAVPVIFSVPTSGASATLAGAQTLQVMTNVDGVASTPAPLANGTVGAYEVVARFGAQAVPFALSNVALPVGVVILQDGFED